MEDQVDENDRRCPECGAALHVDPALPEVGSCDVHGPFKFRARLHFDEGDD